jgi:hypothetical protein
MTGEAVTMSGEATSSPPAEPLLKVETREELVYLLGQACELEHGLMCEYLYAQFSLKRGPDEGLTPAQLDRVQAWEAALISVIKQEMLHLALSTNILTAIGAAPICSNVGLDGMVQRGVAAEATSQHCARCDQLQVLGWSAAHRARRRASPGRTCRSRAASRRGGVHLPRGQFFKALAGAGVAAAAGAAHLTGR